MTNHLDSAFLETFKTLMAKPALFIGTNTDTPRTRKKLLFLAAEYTAQSQGYQIFERESEADGLLKADWIKTKARAFKRSALSKDFWRKWPMGSTADQAIVANDPDNPMSFFKSVEKKDKPPVIETAAIEKEDALSPHDFDWLDELQEDIESRHKQEAYSFEKPMPVGPYVPFVIPGIDFQSFNGTDAVLKNTGDKYATPVPVKMSLPDGGAFDALFVKEMKGFGLKALEAQETMIAQLMKPLNDLIGLEMIKDTLETSVRMALMTQQRKLAGLKTYPLGGHMIFSGNPGTGKTHAARLVASILYSAGILKHGHLIEVDRAALVGEYIGTTEAKTDLVCRAAQGGVLFIDEAYALSASSLGSDYGYEAINVLNKRLEDNAQDFIVIAAGYKNEMENFLRANPGLRSRFHHTVEFRDYTDAELAQIFAGFARRYDYALTKAAQEKLLMVLASIKDNARDKFGNARGARLLFEKTIKRQSRRLMTGGKPVTLKRMKEIIPDDILSDEILRGDKLSYLPSRA